MGRFRLLETLRQFALGKLTDAGEGDAWRRRHAEFFVGLADDAFDATRGPDQVEWFERLEQDHDNLRAALTWAIEADQHEMASRIASGVWWFWNIHGHRKAALDHFDRIVPHLDSVDPALGVKVLVGRAVLTSFDTNSDAGLPNAEQAVRIATQVDEPESLGHVRLSLGLAHFHANRHDNAFSKFRDSYSAFEQSGNQWGMGRATIFPAWIYRMQADVDASER